MVVALCAAATDTAPVVDKTPPVPKRAVVVLFVKDNARTGVKETPPEDPASAVVVISCVADADKATSPAPVRFAPSPNSATERFAIMFKPTDAPRPSVSPVAPPSAGFAVTVDVVWLSVVASKSPPPVMLTATPAPILAVVCVSIRFSAKDPATPTPEAPAPEIAVVVNRFPIFAESGLSDSADK